jgi:hypothetical protein
MSDPPTAADDSQLAERGTVVGKFMRPHKVSGQGLAGAVATAMTASSLGLVFAGSAAAAAAPPVCTDPGLATSGPTDNGDGTTSVILAAGTTSATGTVDIPVGVRSASLDVCGAQGTASGDGASGGAGGRTQATLAITAPQSLLLVAGGNAGGGAAGAGGGAGGGYSAVFRGTTADPTTSVVYAGGGGGGGSAGLAAPGGGGGGGGGGTQGQAGAFGSGAKSGSGGLPGTDIGPGTGGVSPFGGGAGAAGTNQTGGAGGNGSSGNPTAGGGGGGDGWFGGGGGGGGTSSTFGGPPAYGGGGGGGGGSGHVDTGSDVSAGTTTAAAHSGPGVVVVTWVTPVAPTFTSPAFHDQVPPGSPYSRTVTVSATPTATITVDSGTLPPGLTFTDNGDNSATISGTPDTAGIYPFTVRAGNGTTDATQSDSIAVGTAPSFTSPTFADTRTSGSPYSRTVTVSGTPTATITINSGAPPPGITFTDNGNNTATLSGTPTTSGNYPFTLGASNGIAPDDTQSDSISVTAAGGGSSSPSPSPSASPSATPTATVSPSGTPVRRALSLTVQTPTIPAGSTGRLTATGAANEPYRLRCYSRPSTTYTTARTGSFDAAGGPVSFTLSLGRNTRCFIEYATNSTQGASPSVVINVRTVLSLSAVRTAVRSYQFRGRNLPRVAGQLITLYRVDRTDHEIRTANLRTDSSGIYRLTRRFTGSGTFRFRVRTPQTLNNAAGVSNTITVNIH